MLLRKFFFWLSTKKSVTAAIARHGMRYGFAQRFVAGETLEEALVAAGELCRSGRRVILNLLGENVETPDDARQASDTYIDMLGAVARSGLDANISIKLTQLGLDFDQELCLSLAQEIARAALQMRGTIEIDMESSPYVSRTLDIFEQVQEANGNAGVAVQAYLRRSEADIAGLRDRLVLEDRGGSPASAPPPPPKIRLVKGAYLEPAPVAFQKKTEVDANYQKLLDCLLEPDGQSGAPSFFTAIATHDPRLVQHASDKITQFSLLPDVYEFQMIYGIRRDLQQQVFERGHPLRVYVPFGTAWCPYFMRRLAERPANLWFVLRSLFAERPSPR
jgi:proline dehydrogenase